ncbi:DciA family protein [Streptomyces sp. PU_AKi4]|uniref:DciA family protein n=1 Tax=Streptomyces sp. PU_AKi4 TaxID=2800809 RepID=UPI0035246BD2
MIQQPSGIDLARAALAAARADAKTRPTQPQRKTRTTTSRRTRTYGDPMGLGAAITAMMTERDWRPPETGGSILDQWASIAPELADKVAAVRFEHDTGTLHLRPVSPAYATQLRMFRPQILRRIHDKTGDQSVRDLRILPPGAASGSDSEPAVEETTTPAPEEPVKTRETAHPGYRAALEAALTHRPERQPTDPYVVEALARQEAALRASRQPEDEHRDAVWEIDRLTTNQPDPAEAVRRAAIARARQQKAGGDVPHRLFGAA